MQAIDVLIHKPDEFDRAVHGDDAVPALPSGDEIAIITKDGGMLPDEADGGKERAVAVITFIVSVDGKMRRAQFTLSVRLLKTALRMIETGYDDDGMPIPGTWGR